MLHLAQRRAIEPPELASFPLKLVEFIVKFPLVIKRDPPFVVDREFNRDEFVIFVVPRVEVITLLLFAVDI